MILYEIHITLVLKSFDIVHLENYINNNSKLFSDLKCIRPHICHAQSLYGDIKDQAMFTCCILGDNDSVIKKMFIISNDIKDYFNKLGIITRIRNKIEMKDRNHMIDLTNYKSQIINHPYYEFHWKVTAPDTNFGYMIHDLNFDLNPDVNFYRKFLTPHYNDLEKRCLKRGIHLSFNKNKPIKDQYPIATKRFHNCSKEYALESISNDMQYLLSMYCYDKSGTVQFEMAVFDDDIDFDKGWIFKDYPSNIIINEYP